MGDLNSLAAVRGCDSEESLVDTCMTMDILGGKAFDVKEHSKSL